MSIAILVLGYREPECLRASLPLYLAAEAEILVHVDAKADLAAYQQRLGALAERCVFVTPRQPIFWGGFNMVKAEMILLDHALRSSRGHRKLVLVSDDSFPVLGPDRLRAFLDDDLDRLAFRRLAEDEEFTQRYRRFFFFDHVATSLHGRAIESSFVDHDLVRAIADMERLRASGKKQLDLYYGSQWWALTRSTAAEVMRCYQEDFHLTSSFRFSAVPDEMFVPSVVGNVVGFDKARGSCVHVDWSRQPRPFVYDDVDDIRAHINGETAFVRKIASREGFLTELAAAVSAGAL